MIIPPIVFAATSTPFLLWFLVWSESSEALSGALLPSGN
jgi:hypothetical protein